MKSISIALLALIAFNAFSSVNDVGNIGPASRVRLYYKEGNEIVLTGCANNTVLGSTPAEAREKCQGKTFRFRPDVFKKALKASIYSDYKKLFAPFTPEEVEIYWSDDPLMERNAISKEINEIDDFIQAYGRENADLKRRDELVEMLNNWKVKEKFDLAVDALIKEISNQDILVQKTLTNSGKTFGHTLLAIMDPTRKIPCGERKGSIDERINDCSFDTSVSEFTLVSRSILKEEVYLDEKTGHFWGINFGSYLDIARSYCSGSSYHLHNGNLNEVEWKLPNVNEMKIAYDHGLKVIATDMRASAPIPGFWVNSVDGKNGMIFDMEKGTAVINPNERDNFNTKCIGTLK